MAKPGSAKDDGETGEALQSGVKSYERDAETADTEVTAKESDGPVLPTGLSHRTADLSPDVKKSGDQNTSSVGRNKR